MLRLDASVMFGEQHNSLEARGPSMNTPLYDGSSAVCLPITLFTYLFWGFGFFVEITMQQCMIGSCWNTSVGRAVRHEHSSAEMTRFACCCVRKKQSVEAAEQTEGEHTPCATLTCAKRCRGLVTMMTDDDNDNDDDTMMRTSLRPRACASRVDPAQSNCPDHRESREDVQWCPGRRPRAARRSACTQRQVCLRETP
jgi:hypothetical protein